MCIKEDSLLKQYYKKYSAWIDKHNRRDMGQIEVCYRKDYIQ